MQPWGHITPRNVRIDLGSRGSPHLLHCAAHASRNPISALSRSPARADGQAHLPSHHVARSWLVDRSSSLFDTTHCHQRIVNPGCEAVANDRCRWDFHRTPTDEPLVLSATGAFSVCRSTLPSSYHWVHRACAFSPGLPHDSPAHAADLQSHPKMGPERERLAASSLPRSPSEQVGLRSVHVVMLLCATESRGVCFRWRRR
jgi:hypothetical protein